ncbi:MAG: hypothetical protein WCL25_00250 [bacterium]
MKSYKYLILSVAIVTVWLLLSAGPTLAQDDAINLGEPDVLWLWGEVSSIDVAKGIISVKYLDYETDTEKEAVIFVDENTTYENAQAIIDIKPKDIVSIDYVLGAQGSSVARNISVEKPEDTQAIGEGTAVEESLKSEVAADAAIPRGDSTVDLPKSVDSSVQE